MFMDSIDLPRTMPFLFITVYRPLKSSNSWMPGFEKLMDHVLQQNYGSIVCGDFYLNILNMNDTEVANWKNMMCNQFNLEQIVETPTRVKNRYIPYK